jgi:hypothetical protein
MQLIKGFGLVLLAVVAIAIGYGVLAIGYGVLALTGDKKSVETVQPIKAAAVKVDYAKMTIRELKAIAKGTGIKSWERLRKADLAMALSII